jgi:hypothetical protein
MVVVTKAEEVVVPGCPWCHFFSGVINWWIFACLLPGGLNHHRLYLCIRNGSRNARKGGFPVAAPNSRMESFCGRQAHPQLKLDSDT